jgi:hypothetical protein
VRIPHRCPLAQDLCRVAPDLTVTGPDRQRAAISPIKTNSNREKDMQWTTDRRGFLKAAGRPCGDGGPAALRLGGEGDTLRLRVGADFQVLDPFGIIGELDDIIPRCTNVTLVRLGDMREGNQWRPWAAEKIEWLDETRLAFTLREGLTWTGDSARSRRRM